MAGVLTITTLALLAYLSLFQLALAAGAPFGRAAWGGSHRILPPRLRWGSLASALIAVAGLLVVAEYAGYLTLLQQPYYVRGGLVTLTLLFALSTVANSFSSSRLERYLGIPVALLLTLGCAYLAFFG